MSKKVLIVEDDESLRKALSMKIKQSGLTALEATNGLEGLEKIETEHPDLILVDIIMPEMDGITMLGELKQKKLAEDTPIILLTNLSDHDKLAEAMSQGVYDYLIKSDWSLDEIMDKIKEKL